MLVNINGYMQKEKEIDLTIGYVVGRVNTIPYTARQFRKRPHIIITEASV